MLHCPSLYAKTRMVLGAAKEARSLRPKGFRRRVQNPPKLPERGYDAYRIVSYPRDGRNCRRCRPDAACHIGQAQADALIRYIEHLFGLFCAKNRIICL